MFFFVEPDWAFVQPVYNPSNPSRLTCMILIYNPSTTSWLTWSSSTTPPPPPGWPDPCLQPLLLADLILVYNPSTSSWPTWSLSSTPPPPPGRPDPCLQPLHPLLADLILVYYPSGLHPLLADLILVSSLSKMALVLPILKILQKNKFQYNTGGPFLCYSVMQSDRNSSKTNNFHEPTTYEPHV